MTILKVVLALSVFGLRAASGGPWDNREWPVRAQETIQKTLPLAGEPMRVTVDNVEGFVHVSGYDGADVRVTAHKTIRAETEADGRKALEVQLKISGEPGSVRVYYDAPWRCEGERHRGCNDDHERHYYSVTFDIDVQVPREARVVASTVNEGDVKLDGIGGHFDAGNVNGSVALNGMSGSGDADTVNGPVTVRFARNPGEACSFKSINGALDVYFPRDLSADLQFKTFNGEVFSDFAVTSLALRPENGVRRSNGKFVYRSDRMQGARAGGGGPLLSFETLNGSIRLHRNQ